MRMLDDERGQGTVEAAVGIPVLFLLLLLLLQPGVILYDRMVMASAAAEGCRLLATADADAAGSCEAFVRHRLAAIPQHDCFHVHQGECSWDIRLMGDEASQEVTVSIGNSLRPLPLLDAASRLLGMTDGNGNLRIEESVTMKTQPEWVASTELGTDPVSWIGAWSE